MNWGFSPLLIFVLCFCFLVGNMRSLTCVWVVAFSRVGIPRACSTWTVILRMGASYSRAISRLLGPRSKSADGLSGFRSSDLSDLRSLVSKSGSCITSTMHCREEKSFERKQFGEISSWLTSWLLLMSGTSSRLSWCTILDLNDLLPLFLLSILESRSGAALSRIGFTCRRSATSKFHLTVS